jgi:dihydrofolate synthase/folylpolyglutamate synthase
VRKSVSSRRVPLLVTTLASDDPAGRVVQDRANQLGCGILRTDLLPDAAIEDSNATLAGLVLDHLGRQGIRARDKDAHVSGTTEAAVGAWLLDDVTRARARLAGRLEHFEIVVAGDAGQPFKTVPIVLDGAHVPFNLAAVLRDLTLRSALGGGCVAIVALAADKDAAGFLAELSRRAAFVIFTALPGANRGRAPADHQTLAVSLGMKSEVELDQQRALELASRRAAATDTWLLVTGSLHLVGALRATVISRQPIIACN